MILSSFYYGYVLSHLPGGVFADRFGGKHALGSGLLVTSVTTLLSPAAARLGSGYLIALRVVMGLGEVGEPSGRSSGREDAGTLSGASVATEVGKTSREYISV